MPERWEIVDGVGGEEFGGLVLGKFGRCDGERGLRG